MNLKRYVSESSQFLGTNGCLYESIFYVREPYEQAYTMRTFRTQDGQDRASEDWLKLDRCRNAASYEKQLALFKHRLTTGLYDNYRSKN